MRVPRNWYRVRIKEKGKQVYIVDVQLANETLMIRFPNRSAVFTSLPGCKGIKPSRALKLVYKQMKKYVATEKTIYANMLIEGYRRTQRGLDDVAICGVTIEAGELLWNARKTSDEENIDNYLYRYGM